LQAQHQEIIGTGFNGVVNEAPKGFIWVNKYGCCKFYKKDEAFELDKEKTDPTIFCYNGSYATH